MKTKSTKEELRQLLARMEKEIKDLRKLYKEIGKKAKEGATRIHEEDDRSKLAAVRKKWACDEYQARH